MADVTRGITYGATETLTAAKLHSLVDDAAVSNIQASDLANSAVTNDKINDVSGAKFTDLDDIPPGAGAFPEANLPAGAVKTSGDQTIAGVKTFSSSPVVPAPTTDLQAPTKKYVDDHDWAAEDITSGTMDTARLGSGAAGAATYLRGDQTWAAVGGLNISGANVFPSGGAPGTWTDLNLSSVIGSNYALVLLEVVQVGSTSNPTYSFRPNGASRAATGTGVATCTPGAQNKSGFVIITTDSSGVVEWISTDTISAAIYLIAYLK